MQRYFAQNKNGNNLILYETDLHHIKKVMRNQIGDEIEVVYDNIVYICRITKLEPIELDIINKVTENPELPVNLTIAIALVQEQKFDLILQKLTELGVSKIIPIKTERSIVKIDQTKIAKKINRWQLICKEASEQSKRTKITKVENVMQLTDLINLNNSLKLVCSLNEKNLSLDKYLDDLPSDILFVIGPEGGLSNKEETLLLNNDFKPVNLGKRVLRVETAAIYVASIINYKYEG